MTFEFNRVEPGELGLEEAVGQALGAASLCWENLEGTGVFQDGRAKEILDALVLEILTQQRRINATHDEELKVWKTRLNDETGTLRSRLEDRRNRVKNLILSHWGDVELPEGDIANLAALDAGIIDLLAKRDRVIAERDAHGAELERLHDHIVDHFPKFGDRAPVDAAIAILTLLHTHGPALVKFVWEQAMRPALQTLASVGIDILPPGTIVYGASPGTPPHPHRPE